MEFVVRKYVVKILSEDNVRSFSKILSFPLNMKEKICIKMLFFTS